MKLDLFGWNCKGNDKSSNWINDDDENADIHRNYCHMCELASHSVSSSFSSIYVINYNEFVKCMKWDYGSMGYFHDYVLWLMSL